MELYEHIKPPMPSVKPLPPPPQRIQQPVPTAQHSLFDILGKPLIDKYEYPTNDSALWMELFIIASRTNMECVAILEYIRKTGALLTPDDKCGYRIQPIIGPQGWETIEQYNQERNALIPYMDLIKQAMLELKYKVDYNLVAKEGSILNK